MSKRGADEYLTKEHGSTPNSTESSKNKMATAAQLAKRKMAVPKSRQRTGQSPLPGAGASNPFTNTNTFGAPQNSQQSAQTGGFAFGGASQSFPPSDTTANNAFSFSVPGQSSSFTFGQPTTNNPFATLNGNSNNAQPQSQDSNDTMMESPQKKPAFGSGVFGTSSAESSTPSIGFSFGQSTSQPPSQPLFASGSAPVFGGTSSTPLFGQTQDKPQESKPGVNMFGQPTQSQNITSAPSTLFGQSSGTAPQQSPSTGFKFGQPATSAPPSSTFSFGQSSTPAPSSTPSFSFGKATAQPVSNGISFGGSSQSGQNAFSSTTSASQPAAVSAPLFGAVNGTTPANNVFGGFGGTKQNDSPKLTGNTTPTDEPKNFTFSQSAPSSASDLSKAESTPEQSKANPFANLFGQGTAKKADTSSTPAEPVKSGFSFNAPSQPTGLFALPKSADAAPAPKPAEEASKKPLFSFGTPASAMSSSMPKPTEAAPTTTNPFAGLFGNKTQSEEQKTQKPFFGSTDTTSKEDVPAPPPSFGLGLSKTSVSEVPSKPFAGFGTPQSFVPSTSQKKASEDPAPRKETTSAAALGGSTPSRLTETSGSVSDLFTKTIEAAASTPQLTTSSAKQTGGSDGPTRSVNTHPPTRIPQYLNGDDYKSYDSNYRLHSLNREFQKRIASLDPSQHDFENIVRNYVAARESIGESIGLSSRNVAGSKRKADDPMDVEAADLQSAKRSKPADDNTSRPMFGTSQASTSVFQPISLSKPTGSIPTASSTQNSTSLSSNSSSLFNSMIPSSDKEPSAQSSSNPFASLQKSGAPLANNTPSKPTFTFGAAAAEPAGSTTPTKSPPKKPAFEMPKFTAPAGGVNFMDAFKKQSEASAAKLAKEAKEKRKLEEFDSDEDDEEEWERKYEEEERAKKAKLADTTSKGGFTPVFTSTLQAPEKKLFSFGAPASASAPAPKSFTGFGSGGNQNSGISPDKPINVSDNDASGEDDDEEASGDSGDGDNEDAEGEEEEEEADDDDLPEDDVNGEDDNEDDEDDIETALAKSRNKGKSLFERVTPNSNQSKGPTSATSITKSIEKDSQSKPAPFSNVFGKGTPEAPTFSPLTPAGSKEPYVPSKTFNFTPVPSSTSSTPVPGASIFSGGTMKDGPIFGEGLFGSRPSTPSNADKSKSNVFGNLGTPSAPGSDHTWKKGSEIKFGSSTTEAPSVSITAPTPRKNESTAFSGLFGGTTAASNSSTDASVGFSFGQSPVSGFLAAASHLTGGSGTNSGMSSRATSPGTTDNESVATNEEDYANDAQVSLMDTRPGEENEEVIFEVRAKALRFYSKDQIAGTQLSVGWNPIGVGTARLLKHKVTGKSRIVVRADPGANILLNANLQTDFKYEYAALKEAGTVKFNVATQEGLQGWTLKVKTHELGKDLAKVMEENKKPSQ